MKPFALSVALFALLCCLGIQVHAQIIAAPPPPPALPPGFEVPYQYPLEIPQLFSNPQTAIKVPSSPSQCTNHCRRRDVQSWSNEDWDRYVRNFMLLNEKGLLEEFILVHGWSTAHNPGQMTLDLHQSKAFLPWHRLYLSHFEQLLQQMDRENFPGRAEREGEFCLGYWNWAFPNFSNDLTASTYKYLFNGGSRLGSLTPGTFETGPTKIPDGLLKDFLLKNHERLPDIKHPTDFLKRNSTVNTKDGVDGWSLTSIRSCLEIKDYEEPGKNGSGDSFPSDLEAALEAVEQAKELGFRSCLLIGIHGSIHNQIGGSMGIVEYSGIDPVFWLHHTMVDYLWWVWQELPDRSYGKEVDFGEKNPQPYEAWRLDETRDMNRFCYNYAETIPRPYRIGRPLPVDYQGLADPQKTSIQIILKEGEPALQPKDRLYFLKYMSHSQEEFDKHYFKYVKYTLYSQKKYKKYFETYAKTLPAEDQKDLKPPTMSAQKVFDDLIAQNAVQFNVFTAAAPPSVGGNSFASPAPVQDKKAEVNKALDSKADDLSSFAQIA